ncbi:MAG: hypothetical protein VR67_00330 [Peptococcaceae bacterium BRH_c8a]|nr:MAG: hypothetical protein VR67_00330 [Peptococcaceae bacterium BRH_c8a]
MSSNKHRLHPLGILLTAIKVIKDLALPLLAFMASQVLRQALSSWTITLAVALVLAILVMVALSWYRFTYSTEEGVLLVEHGVLVRNKIVIPRERIQSVDFNQGLLQRLFGLVSVQVETAGGKKPEVVLTAVTRREALELRQMLMPSAVAVEHDPQAEPGLHKNLSVGYLLLFGVTSGSGLGVVLAVSSGLWATLDDIGLETKVIEYYQWFVEHGSTVALVAFLLVFIWLLAVLGMVLKYGGFRLTRTGDRIQMVYGLLHRRQVSLPVRRIQALRLSEGLLRQPWGLVTLQVESAGYGPKSAEKALLWPLIRQKDLPRFLQEFLPEFKSEEKRNVPNGTVGGMSPIYGLIGEVPLRQLPPGTRIRYVMRALLPSAPIAALLIVWLYHIGFAYPLLPLSLPLVFMVMGLWNHRDAGWGLRGNMLSIRYRVFSRTKVIVPRRCVQSLTISHTPFQHRAGLATFNLDLASEASFGLLHISASDGIELAGWLESQHQTHQASIRKHF